MNRSSSLARRRGPGFITLSACAECRKKKAKCDGDTPCGRCVLQGGIECVYEGTVRQSKEAMRKEISQLRADQRQTERILAVLTSRELTSRELTSPKHEERVLELSRDGETLQNAVAPFRAAGVWFEPPTDPANDVDPQSARNRGQGHILGHETNTNGCLEDHSLNQDNEPWTVVTDDRELIEHLLALYFCWEYPIFASLSKHHFLEDFKSRTPRYCSQLLVNALLALACRWSDRPSTRAVPGDGITAGDHFFSEALRLLEAESDYRKLTTIQALGLMSIREASCGRVSKSIFFSGQSIRLALEMGLHLDAEDGNRNRAANADEIIRGATFWGAFSLDEAWSLCGGKVPHCSVSTRQLTVKPAIIQEVEFHTWIPYTDDGEAYSNALGVVTDCREGAPLELHYIQPSNLRSVYKAFCELSEIVHRTLYNVYAPGSHTISKVLLNAYGRYILWYDNMPDTLRLGGNFTPAVLFVHLYYQFAILLLFRPFVRFRITTSTVSPLHICTQAANTISMIIKSYSQLYTLQRTPSFVPYIVLSSSIFHLAMVHDSITSDYNRQQLAQNISDLKEMTTCHGFATRALDILRLLAQLWKVDGIFDSTQEGETLQSNSRATFILIGELSPLTGSISMTHNMVPWAYPAENSRDVLFPTQELFPVALSSTLEENGFALVYGGSID